MWEASVRATHTFLSEGDIRAFRRIVRLGLACYQDLYSVRDTGGQIVGFIAVDEGEIEMLFVHPDYHARGAGKRLVRYAVDVLGATKVDVNEQALGFYLLGLVQNDTYVARTPTAPEPLYNPTGRIVNFADD